MHLEERVMSASSISTGKPILPVPLNGQTFVFSSNDCESSICNQAHPATRGDKTHCSCEKSIGHSLNSSYNRLLLPAVNHKNLTSTSTISPSTYADSWLRFQHLGRTNYDSLVPGGFPLYGRLGNESFPALDYALLSNARRKNATRETTSVLKAWLNEHKKNPYPTKGEKVMLAIMTKMTLTQVSTWFANARRRLKKENKMTWLPKKKSGERKDKGNQGSIKSDSDVDDEDMDIDVSVDDNDKVIDSLDNKTSPVEKQQENESIPSVSDLSQSFKGELPRQVIQRPSVIRAVESPTFNQIKERFKDASSPVNSLQHWVNGCFAEPCGDVSDVRQLTPPATPIENQMTTFSEQKLFEIFDANRSKHLVKPPSACSSSSAEPLETLFSSKQPVCSVKETNLSKFADKSVLAVTSSTGVMTPQPSPKSESILLQCKNSLTTTITYDSITKPINSSTTTAANIKIEKPSITQENIECKNDEPKADVRVKGLTTSRELEAVLALTNLSKT